MKRVLLNLEIASKTDASEIHDEIDWGGVGSTKSGRVNGGGRYLFQEGVQL